MLECSDAGALVEANKCFWSACKSALEDAGLSYHVRRGSEKFSQAAAEPDGIIVAFTTLDSLEELPEMYPEANNLLKLPPLAVDTCLSSFMLALGILITSSGPFRASRNSFLLLRLLYPGIL